MQLEAKTKRLLTRTKIVWSQEFASYLKVQPSTYHNNNITVSDNNYSLACGQKYFLHYLILEY